jgi:hypothetical protein
MICGKLQIQLVKVAKYKGLTNILTSLFLLVPNHWLLPDFKRENADLGSKMVLFQEVSLALTLTLPRRKAHLVRGDLHEVTAQRRKAKVKEIQRVVKRAESDPKKVPQARRHVKKPLEQRVSIG